MQILRALTLVSAVALASAVSADPCEEIVTDTVAEMRAGAATSWSADAERLVRAAAGSACVKAASARYGLDRSVARGPGDDGAGTQEEFIGAAASANADAPAPQGNSPQTEETMRNNDDGSWSMGGLTFRSMTGSPGKKPYERQREPKEESEKEN